MSGLFEKSDSLNTPIECFIFDTKQEVFPVKTHWHYFAAIINTAGILFCNPTYMSIILNLAWKALCNITNSFEQSNKNAAIKVNSEVIEMLENYCKQSLKQTRATIFFS